VIILHYHYHYYYHHHQQQHQQPRIRFPYFTAVQLFLRAARSVRNLKRSCDVFGMTTTMTEMMMMMMIKLAGF